MKKNLLLTFLTGIMMWLAFPPFKMGFLAYASLIPFFYLLEEKSFGESFRWGYLTGFISCIGTLYWINWVTLPGGIATIFVLPLYFSIYALIHSFLKEQLGEKFIFAAPFIWTAVEFLRSLGEIGFPWTSLAYTQTYYPILIQYASITSVYGVSFWIILINVLIYQIIKQWGNRKAVFTAPIPSAGQWDLEIHMTNKDRFGRGGWGNWEMNVMAGSDPMPVSFDSGAGTQGWNLVGTFDLPEGEVAVELSDKTDGRVVVADAIRWLPSAGNTRKEDE